MHATIAIPAHHGHPKVEIPLEIPLQKIAITAVAVLAMVFVGGMVTPMINAALVEAPPQTIEFVRGSEVREAPAQYRWERKRSFDHMYRDGASSSGGVDWIRNSGALPTREVRTTR